jgi:hypothetical protein
MISLAQCPRCLEHITTTNIISTHHHGPDEQSLLTHPIQPHNHLLARGESYPPRAASVVVVWFAMYDYPYRFVRMICGTVRWCTGFCWRMIDA